MRGGLGADAAVRVLRELGPSALPALGRLLDGPACDRVLDALPPLGPGLGPLVPQVARQARAGGARAARAVVVLIAAGAEGALHDALDVMPELWLPTLDGLDDPALIGLAVRALFDAEPVIRGAALGALARHPDASVVFAAEIALLRDDPDAEVRAAARALSPPR